MTRLATELEVACQAAREAGAIIRRHYREPTATWRAKADRSPVTDADLEANRAILDRLTGRFPDDGILSEETRDDRRRLDCQRVWIVDPLDGTRDFVQRTGDFAVLIGLAVAGAPVLGVVYAPASDRLHYAVAGGGAFVTEGEGGIATRLAVSTTADLTRFRVGITRLNVSPELERFLAGSELGRHPVTIGASIKMMALAGGDLDLTVCLNADEKEWDTCAPEVVVREAGGVVTDVDGSEFVYNQADVHHHRGILMSNGVRHADLVARVGPYFTP